MIVLVRVPAPSPRRPLHKVLATWFGGGSQSPYLPLNTDELFDGSVCRWFHGEAVTGNCRRVKPKEC